MVKKRLGGSVDRRWLVLFTLIVISLPLTLAIIGELGNARIIIRADVGEAVEKYILVKNSNDIPVTITLTKLGDLVDNMILQEEGFILQPGEEKRAYFTIWSDEQGTFESKIRVMFSAEGEQDVGLDSTIILIAGNELLEADVAYILKYSNSPENKIIASLEELDLSYNLIDDSEILSTDFSKYRMILVNGDRFGSLANSIPVNNKEALFLGGEHVDDWKWAADDVVKGTSQVIKGRILISNSITNGFSSPIPLTLSGGTYYVLPKIPARPTSIDNVVSSDDFDRYPIIATVEPGDVLRNNKVVTARGVFFGLADTDNWNSNAKQLFKNSIEWVLGNQDFDGDGFISEYDCDDTNPAINPDADDIPYNGIDEDCDGSDLTDVDGDGFDAIIAGGSDCDDNDAEVNPGSPDPYLDCVNSPPELYRQIPPVTVYEDTPLENALNLFDYFLDADSEMTFIEPLSDNIGIVIEDGWVSFYPEPDFWGVEEIYFAVTDTYSPAVISNPVLVEVIDVGEIPVLSELDCETDILEDVDYSCPLEASDFEGDALTFSASDENNLNCVIVENELRYSSFDNYHGEASCKIIVTDQHGSDTMFFVVDISPVNDAPEITSFSPEDSVATVIEGFSREFSVEAEDIDSDFDIMWFLNGVEKDSGFDFLFSGEVGRYILRAEASDGELTDSRSWSVIVGPTSDFTCSEVGGFVIEEDEACTGSILDVADTDSCCSVSGSPGFKDADSCEILDNDIEIEIKSPGAGDEFELGKTIEVELDIRSYLDEDQDFNVEAHLYNLNTDESEEYADADVEVRADRARILKLDLVIPEYIDLDDEYSLFVKAEGDACNQEYVLLKFKRAEQDIAITDFEIPSAAECGDIINAGVRVENQGSESQDVRLSVESDGLGIDEESDLFELEEFDGDNKERKDFVLLIPSDAEQGEHDIEAVASFGSKEDRVTRKIDVICAGEENFEVQEALETETITLGNGSPQVKELPQKKEPNYPLVAGIAALEFILVASVGLLYVIWAGKR